MLSGCVISNLFMAIFLQVKDVCPMALNLKHVIRSSVKKIRYWESLSFISSDPGMLGASSCFMNICLRKLNMCS